MQNQAGQRGSAVRGRARRIEGHLPGAWRMRGPLPGLTPRRGPSLWAGLLALCLGLAPVSGQLTLEDQAFLLDTHNSYRGTVQPSAAYMMPMRWDENLRILAESYAVKCIWNHNPDLEELGTGENLYTSTGPLNLRKAMDGWFNEHQYFTYQNNSCQDDKMCGHYTQIVWADTTAVGCAVHRCDTLEGLDGFDKANLLVCNYAPTGNYEEQLPYVEGAWCSRCPENHQRCLNNLCMPDLEPTEEPETPPPASPDPSDAQDPADPSEPPLASTARPPTPADTEGPALDLASSLAPTLEHEDVTEAGWGERPVPGGEERPGRTPVREERPVSRGGASTTPALLLISALVLLSLGA